MRASKHEVGEGRAYNEDRKFVIKLRQTPTFKDLGLKEIAENFLHSEFIYVERGLRPCVEQFQMRIDRTREFGEPVLDQLNQMQLFQNIEMLYDFHKKLHQSLTILRYEGIQIFLEDLGNLMLEVIPFFRLYAQYVNKYSPNRVQDLKQSHSMFTKFIQLEEACCGNDLATLLSLPVYRLPQYMAYLAQMASRTQADTDAREELQGAITEIQKVCDEITKKQANEKKRNKVVSISKEVFNDEMNLIAPHRLFVRAGVVNLIRDKKDVGMFQSQKKEYDMWLFNDMLVLGHKGGAGIGRLLGKAGNISAVMRIEGMAVESVPNQDDEHYFTVTSTIDPAKPERWLLTTKEEKDKSKWISILTKIIDRGNADVDNIRRGEWIPTSEAFYNSIVGKANNKQLQQIRRPNYQKPNQGRRFTVGPNAQRLKGRRRSAERVLSDGGTGGTGRTTTSPHGGTGRTTTSPDRKSVV